MLLNLSEPLPATGRVELTLLDDLENPYVLVVTPDQVTWNDELIPDADASFAESIEIRIPRRLFSRSAPYIAQTCVLVAAQTDCYTETVQPEETRELDPIPVRFGSIPLATVRNDANLRAGPGTTYRVVDGLLIGEQLALLGRNQFGDWLRVRNGRYDGWVADAVVVENADIQKLPVVDAP
jgi:hypothetical protein